MKSLSPSAVNSEESLFTEGSTAPTTPEGSLSFSPVLRPRNVEGMDEEAAAFSAKPPHDTQTLSSTVPRAAPSVRNICCVGAGYVGGPTAAVVAFQNPHIRVTVVDKDVTRIRRWNSRHPPIYEPGLEDIVRIARDGSRECAFANEPVALETSDALSDISTSSSECASQGQCIGDRGKFTVVPARQPNLFFSTNVSKCIAEADVVLIAVNTPTKYRGAGAGSATDMTAFEAVTSEVAQHARPGAIIVEKSTVPCRTAEMVRETMAVHRPGVHFEILSNPEFLAAGTAMTDLMYPDRVLIGSSTSISGQRAAEALASVYAAWVPRTRILTTNVWSSELAKLVANSMLAQRISSINSIAAICERTGADVDEVASSIGCDPRIGDKFLKAGIGFGGSCFKKDILSLVYLAQSLDLDEVAEYWTQVVKMNEYSRDRFAKRVIKCLNNTLAGKKVAVLGYAFKKNTNDTRESPALEIIKTLLEEGPREVALFDPCCNVVVMRQEIRSLLRDVNGGRILREDGGPLAVYSSAYEACAAATAVLITTEFDEFRNTKPGSSVTPEGLEQKTAPPKVTVPAGPTRPKRNVDPRPFARLEPTESDLLALHKYLIRAADVGASTATLTGEGHYRFPVTRSLERKAPCTSNGSFTTTSATDPLCRLNPEPACAEECPDCRLENSGYSPNEEYRPKDHLDWAKISYHMRKPKWVFDGRGVIDAREMAELGVRVESVGRRGR